MHQLRAVALSGYIEVANFVGLDGRRMLQEAGVSWQALEDPENRIPAATVVRLMEDAAERSGCESFGLLVASTRSFASLGPVSLLLERLPNMREIVRVATEFQRHLGDILEISTEDSGEVCLLKLNPLPGYWSVQALDWMVGVANGVLRGASGNSWRPAAVHLVRSPPSDMSVWRRAFGVPIEFESSFNGFSSSHEAMLQPNPGAEAAMARNARRLLQLIQPHALASPISERVRRSIILLLPSGRANVDVVASHLGVSRRSLQRSLHAEGHRFGDLLDNVRQELAKAYLANSAHPITSVAAMLGYGSPSSFTRWFAGEFGTSPQTWRSAAAGRERDRSLS